ncbi:MAG TPA: hypothetical protein VFA66_08820 [Gaiellaceae bacterium]|nr:hypothetical protein [Gaiellaceae bacterium]
MRLGRYLRRGPVHPFAPGLKTLTLRAVTFTPLSLLVPATNVQSPTLIADIVTRTSSEICVLDETATLVVPRLPRTVTVELRTATILPAAKPPFPRGAGVRGGRRAPDGGLLAPGRRLNIVWHAPFTGAETVSRVAWTTPPLLFWPPANTHRPLLSRVRLTVFSSVIAVVEATCTLDLPVGLSDERRVKV